MTENKYILVRLKLPIIEDDKEIGYEDYVTWIPLKLAKKAKELKKPINLFFEESNEWKKGFILDSKEDLSETISEERANNMFTRLQQFRHYKVAGRPSYKD